ncbi:TetR/AcrR family transcriptional regulator [Motilibacter aurantiacus]|uniref:TetR/AcrR family transcriptional regulator n=1 Tax=Motilibacter aurantiacus TaxID=2714955 RepID=UPI002F2B58B9
MTAQQLDARRARGARTRVTVLDRAVELAASDGLEGLTLSRLAAALHVSKSGLFAHWASKEQLQLAAIEHARSQWATRVVAPALARPRGLPRLWGLHEERLAMYAADAVPGCFFVTVEAELAGRPGPLRSRVAEVLTEWLEVVEGAVARSVELGHLPAGLDPALLAYEVEAAGVAAAYQSRLLDPDVVAARSRRVVLDRLRSLATDASLLPDS